MWYGLIGSVILNVVLIFVLVLRSKPVGTLTLNYTPDNFVRMELYLDVLLDYLMSKNHITLKIDTAIFKE